MNRRDLLACLSAGAVLPQLAGCELLGLEWRYRYRLTGEVRRGDEIYRGSNVFEITRAKGIQSIGGTIRGEAVAVDLPGAKTLFLLMREEGDGSPDWPFRMPHKALASLIGGSNMVNPELLDNLVRLPVGTAITLPPELYPTIVCFDDPLDPRTIRKVDKNDLSNAVGGACELYKISIEITRDEPSEHLQDKLPWMSPPSKLATFRKFRLTNTPTLFEQIKYWHFRQGM